MADSRSGGQSTTSGGKRKPSRLRGSLGRLRVYASNVWDDHTWLTHGLNLPRAFNILRTGWEYATKRERVGCLPMMLKVDISPLCNLHCTVCVHAHAHGNPSLERQRFHSGQRMTVAQFAHIVDSLRGRGSAISLYNLGDPLTYPDLAELCRITHQARVNSHVNSNFSFRLSDDRLEGLVRSGLTHLTVCVDGLSQEVYQKTRVGGNIALVLSNLRRVCQIRRRLRQRWPRIEIQYIRFQHNLHEEQPLRELGASLGIDQFTALPGSLSNFTDRDPEKFTVLGPKKPQALPMCVWPYMGMVIRYDGDVLPCCYHRLGHVHAEGGHVPTMGNVFRTSLAEVWNSPAYQMGRRIVSDPGRAIADPAAAASFCYGCHVPFETGLGREQYLPSSLYRYEQVFTVNESGIPVRRPRVLEDPLSASEPCSANR